MAFFQMAPPNFESGFIATIVLLAVAVAVIAMLAGLGSYGPPKPKPTPEPAPPATLASLAKRARAAFKPRLAGAKLKSVRDYDSCLEQCKIDVAEPPLEGLVDPVSYCYGEACGHLRPPASLRNAGKLCLRVSVADDASMSKPEVYDLGPKIDGSIVECGSGSISATNVVSGSSWLVFEQRYLGSSYDKTYPFQVVWQYGTQKPAMEFGSQQVILVDPDTSTITIGL